MANFIWNCDYIAEHILDSKIVGDAGIELIAEDEIFVEHQNYECYYVSQYGRVISMKHKKLRMLRQTRQGKKENPYPAVSFSRNGWRNGYSVGRVVADIFCPNFWSRFKKSSWVVDLTDLEAHHCDRDPNNNNYLNLILLPSYWHHVAHTIESYALLDGTEMYECINPLRIVEKTNLYPDEIIDAGWNQKGELRADGYTMYNVEGYQIGLKYKKQAEKTKKQK